MEIRGGKAYAVIFEDGAVYYEVNDEDSGWDTSFKEYTIYNFGLSWAT